MRVLTSLLLLASLVPSAALSKTLESTTVVQRFVAAYNNHDVQAMLGHCREDVRWLSVSGDAVSVEADGKAALRASMQSHFQTQPNTHSTLLAATGDGPMVVAIEQATAGEGSPSHCSASVYQLKDGLIQNVWYFDAYRCTTPLPRQPSE